MEFKQISIGEFRQDAISDFNIIADGFHIALIGATTETPALELNCHKVPYKPFPYLFDMITIPQERPCHHFIQQVDLPIIYANCDVLQSQQLALETVYVADSSVDPPKAKIQQVCWIMQNDRVYIAVLTNYGACQIRAKNKTLRQWCDTILDLNLLYRNEVFPLIVDLKNLKTLDEFKNVIDLHWITALARDQNNLIYTANALGWIVAFRFEAENNAREYVKLKTNLGKISYMKTFDHFVLVGNVFGVVKLFRINHSNANENCAVLNEVECLWSKSDRMSCRKAEVTYLKDLNCYMVIFTKAAHILAYQLSADGVIISSRTLYAGGIKITGVETLNNNEFILTTINGLTKHLSITFDSGNEFQINEKDIPSDLDVINYQILGVAATPNKNLWSFMLFRNKSYSRHAKCPNHTAFLSICKITNINSLQKLANINLNTLDTYMDYAVAVHLDIVNSFDLEEYDKFFELQNACFPNELNDAFLQKLQIKLAIQQSFLGFQREKFKNTKQSTVIEIEFLIACVEATSIILRMQHLKRKIGEKAPTAFQTLAGRCLNLKFNNVMESLHTWANIEGNHIKDTTERFANLATKAFQTLSYHYEPCKELCSVCNEVVSETTMMCCNQHRTRRCCISYVQVRLFNNRHCIQCKEPALEDDNQLRQILAPDETLKCTFCRYTFSKEEF